MTVFFRSRMRGTRRSAFPGAGGAVPGTGSAVPGAGSAAISAAAPPAVPDKIKNGEDDPDRNDGQGDIIGNCHPFTSFRGAGFREAFPI